MIGFTTLKRVLLASATLGFAAHAAAFEDLVAWIERGIVPEGDDVLGDVTKLAHSIREIKFARVRRARSPGLTGRLSDTLGTRL